jgi:hypothetical protein
MARRILVVTTTDASEEAVAETVRGHAGEDAEIEIVAPASKISWLDRLANAEDDARAEAADRAEATSQAFPGVRTAAHVGDVDPLQAIEDALRLYPADEIVVVSDPDEEASWLESGLAAKASRRFAVPLTHLVTR